MNSASPSADPARVRAALDRLVESGDGVLRLEAAWVARDFLPPGRRLGLPEDQYDVGKRGYICERWLGSTTPADNTVGPPDEGLSSIVGDDGEHLLLKDAVQADPDAIMGSRVRARTPRRPRAARQALRLRRPSAVPHPSATAVRQPGGRNSKDEAYYFPAGVDMGAHPESFFGVHPWILRERSYDTLLPYLVDWDSDLILRHAPAHLLVATRAS